MEREIDSEGNTVADNVLDTLRNIECFLEKIVDGLDEIKKAIRSLD